MKQFSNTPLETTSKAVYCKNMGVEPHVVSGSRTVNTADSRNHLQTHCILGLQGRCKPGVTYYTFPPLQALFISGVETGEGRKSNDLIVRRSSMKDKCVQLPPCADSGAARPVKNKIGFDVVSAAPEPVRTTRVLLKKDYRLTELGWLYRKNLPHRLRRLCDNRLLASNASLARELRCCAEYLGISTREAKESVQVQVWYNFRDKEGREVSFVSSHPEPAPLFSDVWIDVPTEEEVLKNRFNAGACHE